MLRLPDWVDGKRALGAVAKALSDRGLTLATQASLLDQPDNPQTVMLPGFAVFDHAGGLRALDWCLPRTRLDRDEILGIYEEYVDRPLGRVPVPDRVARGVFSGKSADTVFGERRSPAQWWLPAAQLIAVASAKTKIAAKYTEDTVSLDLGDYQMSVTPEGCWSNFRGRLKTAADLPDDANIGALRVPLLMTKHPLAGALAAHSMPVGVLWAANCAIRAESAGRIPKIRAAHLGVLRKSRGRGPRRLKASVADVVGAISASREMLDGPEYATLRDLYKVAVPTLMTVTDFTDLLADPWGRSALEGKPIGSGVRARMHEFLDVKEGERTCRPSFAH